MYTKQILTKSIKSLYVVMLFLSISTAGLILINKEAKAAPGLTYNVNSTVDAVDSNPGDGNCKTSGNVCTLRAAIQETNQVPGIHTINLAAGTYKLTIAGMGEGIAAKGDLDINGSSRIIKGIGVNSTIIDANSLDRAFDVGVVGLTLENLTVKGGYLGGVTSVSDPSNAKMFGGAIYSTGTLTLNSVTVKENNLDPVSASGTGVNNEGSAIYTDNANVFINDSSITNNYNNCFVECDGSIIFNSDNAGNFNLNIKRSLIANNYKADDSLYSGALIVRGGKSNRIENTTITNNGLGSAGYETDFAVIPENNAELPMVTLVNSTIVNTIATGADSFAVYGDSDTLKVQNTLIYGKNNKDCDPYGATYVSLGGNLRTDTNCVASSPVSTDITNSNPKLGALQNNGGKTSTYALLSGSPAIDKGINTGCPTTDQRGITRPYNSKCDIGAYEYTSAVVNPTPTPTVTPKPTTTPTPSSGHVKVYRFYNASTKAHFFTKNAAEKDALIATNPNWSYEAVAYYVINTNSLENCNATGGKPVHRFYGDPATGGNQTHFFTINGAEADAIKSSNPQWRYEGIAWCAQTSNVSGTTAVYRFGNVLSNSHFYTINKAESDAVKTNPEWRFEGIDYYTYTK